MIYFLTFIALILIFSTGLWLWMNRINAPVLRKMVDEEQILPDEPEVNAKDKS